MCCCSAGPSHERRVQRQDAGTCGSWGQLTEVMFLKTDTALVGDVLQMGRRHTIRHRARCVAWTYRHSSCDEVGTKATGGGACDALEPLGYPSGSNLSLSGGTARIHRIGQT